MFQVDEILPWSKKKSDKIQNPVGDQAKAKLLVVETQEINVIVFFHHFFSARPRRLFQLEQAPSIGRRPSFSCRRDVCVLIAVIGLC